MAVADLTNNDKQKTSTGKETVVIRDKFEEIRGADHRRRAGDVVQVTGSGRTFQPTEGIGVWQYSFEDWKRQSALV